MPDAVSSLRWWLRCELTRWGLLGGHPGRVMSQNSDGTLEIKSDSDMCPSWARVPLFVGIPGASVTVDPGARVIVHLEGGDPTRPVATLWEAAGLRELTIVATERAKIDAPEILLGEAADPNGSGGYALARDGDLVEVPVAPVPLSLTGTAAGLAFAGTTEPFPTLVGVIEGTSARVKA